MANKTTKHLTNKKMNDSTYELRRRVMNLIYEIKTFANIPRIDIRITDSHESVLGVGRMKKNIIWITERAITSNEFDLRTLVYHEVLHAVYGVQHNNDCPLMRETHLPLSSIEAKKAFLEYCK